ncbi:MAG: paraslipin [Sphingobacterium sp.]|nr:paraslipin [Sphingobacterium sp.]
MAEVISLKEQVLDFAPQAVITKDNVTMQIDTVVFLQITDAKLFVYGADNPGLLIEHLTATTLRNIIGELELDETLTSRDLINERMRNILDDRDRPVGHQDQPRRTEEHHPAEGNPRGDGEADARRTRTPRIDPDRRRQEGLRRSSKPKAKSCPPSCAPKPRRKPPSAKPKAAPNRS